MKSKVKTVKTEKTVVVPDRSIAELIQDPKVLFVISHSGGKDSQAMYLYLRDKIPSNQMIIIHADLAEVEWEDTFAHIIETTNIHDKIFKVKSTETFVTMVEKRGMFPSSQSRQCTGTLKKIPIFKKAYQYAKDHGFTTIVNCMGMRAEESGPRSKLPSYEIAVDRTLKNGQRTVINWLPIHHWTARDVFSFIQVNGQKPHWAYLKGMSRLSCCFCIMANRQDLKVSAEHNPVLLDTIADLETKIGHTMFMHQNKPIGIKEYINTPYKREPKVLQTYQNCNA